MNVIPGLLVSGQQGPLDRGSPAPARQKRGMDIDAAQSWQVQRWRRQQSPVGADQHHIGAQLRQMPAFRIIKTLGLVHAQAGICRQCLDRTGAYLSTAPGRSVRLGVDANDAVLTCKQGLQEGRCKFRGSRKYDVKGARCRHACSQGTAAYRNHKVIEREGGGVDCPAFCALSSFFFRRSLFKGDR